LRKPALVTALALSLLQAATLARADEAPAERVHVERRGLRRAGIALFTAGVSALPSSAALWLATERRFGTESATMAIAGHALMAAGIPMWVIGAPGRRTQPRNRTMMYAGLVLAGVGLAALPPSSALFAASFDEGADDHTRERLRLGALLGCAGANALIVAGIPLWALGAAAPEDTVSTAPVELSLAASAASIRGRF
jgi:hypothetical protein